MSSSSDRSFLPQLRTTKNLVVHKIEPIYIPELERYKWQIHSYVSKRRERWYESLGPSKEELHKHHDNVNLLRDYTTKEKILEKKKLLEQNKSLLIREEEHLKSLIDTCYDNNVLQLINEAHEMQVQRKCLENALLSIKEAHNFSIQSLCAERTFLNEIMECKNFVTTLLKDTNNIMESVDIEQVFDQFEQQTKVLIAETSVKSVEIQKLSKTLSTRIKHWTHDVDEQKLRREFLLSQISKEEKRLNWLKETLTQLSLPA